MRRLFPLFAVVLAACAEGGTGGGDALPADLWTHADVPADDGVADLPGQDAVIDADVPDARPDLPGAETVGDAGGDLPSGDLPPILERPVRPKHACVKVHDALKIDLGGGEPWMHLWGGAELVPGPGGPLLVREANSPGVGTVLEVSSAAVGGTVGAATTVTALDSYSGYPFDVDVRDGVVGVLYLGSVASQPKVAFLSFGQDGKVLDGPVQLPAGQGSYGGRLIATVDGWAVLNASQDAGATVKLLRLAPDGTPVGTAVDLGVASSVMGVALVATPSGFAAAWSEVGPWAQGQAQKFAIRFRPLDATGQPAGPATLVSPAGTKAMWPVLLARDGGFLAAWSESTFNEDYANPKGWSIVRLAALDAAGAVVGPVHTVQSPVNDRDRHQPWLVDLDGDVGLGYRDETRIYVCAGCVSDAVQWFVPLHGSDLAPAGEPVSFASMAGGGGVGRPSVVRMGNEFLAHAPIEFHAWSVPALLAWRCE